MNRCTVLTTDENKYKSCDKRGNSETKVNALPFERQCLELENRLHLLAVLLARPERMTKHRAEKRQR